MWSWIKTKTASLYTWIHMYMYSCMCTILCRCWDGLVAEIPNPAVSSSLLQEIQQMKVNGLTEQDIFSRLRSRTVPAGYAYTTWKPGMVTMSVLHAHVHILYGWLLHLGKSETETEVLRSILSQLEFAWLVRDYDDRLGVPFRHRLYVPENHPITKEPFCEREDEAHVLKVCCNNYMYIYQ